MSRILQVTLGLVLFGCAANPVNIPTKYERTPLNLQDPAPLALSSVHWYVLTKDTADAYWNETDHKVIMGLAPLDYQKLVVDDSLKFEFSAEYKKLLDEYRLYYEPSVVKKTK